MLHLPETSRFHIFFGCLSSCCPWKTEGIVQSGDSIGDPPTAMFLNNKQWGRHRMMMLNLMTGRRFHVFYFRKHLWGDMGPKMGPTKWHFRESWSTDRFWRFWSTLFPDTHIWLVVWNMFYFSHILGMSSSQLTNSIIFQRGRAQPPSSHMFLGLKPPSPWCHTSLFPVVSHPQILRLCQVRSGAGAEVAAPWTNGIHGDGHSWHSELENPPFPEVNPLSMGHLYHSKLLVYWSVYVYILLLPYTWNMKKDLPWF